MIGASAYPRPFVLRLEPDVLRRLFPCIFFSFSALDKTCPYNRF
jgi:hypothetical protein